MILNIFKVALFISITLNIIFGINYCSNSSSQSTFGNYNAKIREIKNKQKMLQPLTLEERLILARHEGYTESIEIHLTANTPEVFDMTRANLKLRFYHQAPNGTLIKVIQKEKVVLKLRDNGFNQVAFETNGMPVTFLANNDCALSAHFLQTP